MRLNGWQRLWVVLTLLWTITVGVVTWQAWPPTYLSADLNAGTPLPPVGSDVTFLMDDVIKANERLTRAEFAARLKAKYPVYADLADDDLVDRTLKKFPQYSVFMDPVDDFEPDTPEDVAKLNRDNRTAAVRRGLMLWLLPPLAVYGLGWSAVWIRRGFKATP